MYDPKTIRRRRAVLVLLVVCSVVLLTASFGGNGGVGSVQRGVFEIVSPVQDVANRSLKPFRDLLGWFGDTWHAKGDNKQLKKERDTYRTENVNLQSQIRRLEERYQLKKVTDVPGIDQLGPVEARVIGGGGSLLFARITINKGSADGLKPGQPVIASGGLAGRVYDVVGGKSIVMLLTDSKFGVQTRAVGSDDSAGTVETSGGNPEDLVMQTTKPKAAVAISSTIVTSGTAPGATRPSLYPPDIPIGKVTEVDDAGTDTQRIHLRPFVDVRNLEHVIVLTRDPSDLP